MKILQIAHSFLPHSVAGVEVYTYSLCRQLTASHQVFVFHRISNLKSKEYEIRFKKDENLFVYSINNTFRRSYSFEDLYINRSIEKEFEKILDEINPDIVHIQHLAFLSIGLLKNIKERNIPVVFTLHDYWLICPNCQLLRRDLSLCDGNDVIQCIDCLDCLYIKRLPKKIFLCIRNVIPKGFLNFFRKIYLDCAKGATDILFAKNKIEVRINYMKEIFELVDIFVAPSKFLMEMFIKFGIPENKIRFIRNGIDSKPLESFRKKNSSDKMRFGFIGTMLPAKGLDILINAFNMIQNKKVELKIYGKLFPCDGFEYYLKRIKKLAKNSNIKFMGEFHNRDIAKVFSEIDILVVPSIWNENSPLVIQEAFLYRIPVIASRAGGIPELVNDGVNGLLFSAGDIRDLKEKLEYIIGDYKIINRFKENMPEIKSIKKNAEELEEIYKNLIKKGLANN